MKLHLVVAGFLSTALISVPIKALATDWFMAGSDQGDTVHVFVDHDSINHSGNIAKANLFTVYSTPGKTGSIGYTAIREFSCSDKRIRDTKIVYLNEDGSKRLGTKIEDWETTKPDSIAEYVLEQVCGMHN